MSQIKPIATDAPFLAASMKFLASSSCGITKSSPDLYLLSSEIKTHNVKNVHNVHMHMVMCICDMVPIDRIQCAQCAYDTH